MMLIRLMIRLRNAARLGGRGLVVVSLIVCGCWSSAQAQSMDRRGSPAAGGISGRSSFFVGGAYVGNLSGKVMHGQMFVEKLTPSRVRHRYPIVLIHGGGQTATNWMNTPDGRMGWAEYFCIKGYVVYLADQPARGRSAWHEGIDGKVQTLGVPTVERFFTASEQYKLWPQARLHNQWPGSGRAGDPIFDQFYASQVQFLSSNVETQDLMQKAGAALLDQIGPAILLTHSQSGAFGWLIADARPKLVKAVIAVEPYGPPFQDAILGKGRARPWGLTDIPITYDPPITDPAQLQIEQQVASDSSDLLQCWKQKEPVHSLLNMRDIPVMLVTSEASYHAYYDHCTARYLVQAGVRTDFIRLEAKGVHGNGHMMMLEKNNIQIAELIASWLFQNAR